MDSDGNKEGNGNCNKGGGPVMATATKRAMVTAIRVVGDEEGNGDGNNSNADDNECGG